MFYLNSLWIPAHVVHAYEIDADPTIYSFTGSASVQIRHGYLLAEPATYAFTGTAATLHKVQVPLAADPGIYAFQGSVTSLEYGFKLVAEQGTYGFIGTPVTFHRNRAVVAGTASYALIGTDGTFRTTKKLIADAGSYAFSGTNVTLRKNLPPLVAGGGSYALTGSSATLTYAAGAWNAADKAATVTLSNGNNTATVASGNAYAMVRSVVSHSSGKWYAEFTCTTVSSAYSMGIANSSASLSNYLGSSNDSGGMRFNGDWQPTSALINPPGMDDGDIVRLAVDLDANLIWFAVNAGVWSVYTSPGDPAAGTGGVALPSGITSGVRYLAWNGFGQVIVGPDVVVVNTGASAFTYSVPSGFTAWG